MFLALNMMFNLKALLKIKIMKIIHHMQVPPNYGINKYDHVLLDIYDFFEEIKNLKGYIIKLF